jgi:hypothetical protein
VLNDDAGKTKAMVVVSCRPRRTRAAREACRLPACIILLIVIALVVFVVVQVWRPLLDKACRI